MGSSGAGKTWLADRLATLLGVEHVELDAIHHQADWQTLPAEEMRRLVDHRCPADGAWVVDGNYSEKGGRLVRDRAEIVVWVDLPRTVVMRQLSARTLRRGITRQELWNGNRESLLDAFSFDPERSVLRWSFTQYPAQRARYTAEADERWVRVRSRAAILRYLADLEGSIRGRSVEP